MGKSDSLRVVRDTDQRLRELEQQVDELSSDLRVLRGLVDQDHPSALNKIRYVTEKVLHGLCAKHDVSWGAKEPTLENMIGPLIAAKVIPKSVAVHVRTIQTNASPGSHFQEDALSSTHVYVAQVGLLELLEWFYKADERRPSVSQPIARAAAAPKSRRSWALAAAAVVVVAVAVVLVLKLRGSGPAPKPSIIPQAGLDAIERYQHPRGGSAELDSPALWQLAMEDFAAASKQRGAPARWRAGAELARGMSATLRGDHDQAVTAFRAAIAADPGWAAAHAALAEALARQKKTEPALAAAREAQRLEPGSWVWIATGASVHVSANNLDQAIVEYRRALALAPNEPSLLADVALVYHAARLDSEAERHAKAALAIDDNLVAPRILLAERALENGDASTALTEATRALSIAPDNVPALLSVGDAKLRLDDLDGARAAYEKALAVWKRLQATGAAEARLSAVAEALATERIETLTGLLDQIERSRAAASLAQTAEARRLAARQLEEMRSKRKEDRSKKLKLQFSKDCQTNPLSPNCY